MSVNCKDHEIDHKISARKDIKNIADIDISSYVGISAGAVHSYGKIKVLEGNLDEWISIELTRKVTKADKNLNGGRSFECWRLGDFTDRFNSEKDIIKVAKKVFKKVFGKGWKLAVKKTRKRKDRLGNYYEEYRKIIAEND